MTMTYRPLGDTGMHVSSYCLGTLMLGAIGNADPMEQLQSLLASATTSLDESTLDRIDEIVPPAPTPMNSKGSGAHRS